jgi:hypothetical protein
LTKRRPAGLSCVALELDTGQAAGSGVRLSVKSAGPGQSGCSQEDSISMMRHQARLAAFIALLAGLACLPQPTFPAPEDAAAGSASVPSNQHRLLKRDVGVWDATMTDFKSRIDGAPFEGHALFGYDTVKQKYVRLWVDSSQALFWPSEGSYDPATDSLTMWMESIDSDGRPTRWRTVTVWKDDDTRIFTMHLPGPETVEAAGMTITYKRRR